MQSLQRFCRILALNTLLWKNPTRKINSCNNFLEKSCEEITFFKNSWERNLSNDFVRFFPGIEPNNIHILARPWKIPARAFQETQFSQPEVFQQKWCFLNPTLKKKITEGRDIKPPGTLTENRSTISINAVILFLSLSKSRVILYIWLLYYSFRRYFTVRGRGDY